MLGLASWPTTNVGAGTSLATPLTVGTGVLTAAFKPGTDQLVSRRTRGRKAYLRYLHDVHENWTLVLFLGACCAEDGSWGLAVSDMTQVESKMNKWQYKRTRTSPRNLARLTWGRMEGSEGGTAARRDRLRF